MRRFLIVPALLGVLALLPSAASADTLVCPPNGASGACIPKSQIDAASARTIADAQQYQATHAAADAANAAAQAAAPPAQKLTPPAPPANVAPASTPATPPPPPACLAGFEDLTYFLANAPAGKPNFPTVNMKCYDSQLSAPTTDPTTGDQSIPFFYGTAYWRASTGYTVFTDGATHWAICTQAKAPATQLCTVTPQRDGYIWTTGEVDPPANIQLSSAVQAAAKAAADPYKDWTVDQLRARQADLQYQVANIEAQAQCHWQPGDPIADVTACRNTGISILMTAQPLKAELLQLNAELMRRSYGN
jgi:hypothetical protein